MKLVVGLGNPGEEYKDTRHNVGFMVVDALGLRPSDGIVLVKPETFMNRSGEAVKKLVNKYKVQSTNLYVIHDDLDIPLGKYKIQKGRGPKEHRGILSIEQSLGKKDFWRVRIGVENRSSDMAGDEYVLDNFTAEERAIIDGVIQDVVKDLWVVLNQ